MDLVVVVLLLGVVLPMLAVVVGVVVVASLDNLSVSCHWDSALTKLDGR